MANDILDILLASARKEFERWRLRELTSRPEDRGWQPGLWALVEDLGLPRCLAAEAHDGADLPVADGLAVVRLAGEYALPVPLAETMLAHHLLSLAGLKGPDGPLTLAPVPPAAPLMQTRLSDGTLIVDGTAHRVPWGRDANAVIAIAASASGPVLIIAGKGGFEVRHGANLASEPRDTLVFRNAPVLAHAPAPVTPDQLLCWGASLRVAQMAGATVEALRVSVDYANTREQFGRTIAKFQVIQQHLAVLAGQSAICAGAADIAARALAANSDPFFGVACAKACAGEASTLAASIAHQVLGAIGFSSEHDLHRTTQRLLSWRDEFGAEAWWAGRLGEAALAAGGDGLWPLMTA